MAVADFFTYGYVPDPKTIYAAHSQIAGRRTS